MILVNHRMILMASQYIQMPPGNDLPLVVERPINPILIFAIKNQLPFDTSDLAFGPPKIVINFNMSTANSHHHTPALPLVRNLL
jgi:hypothetical protein